jgi:tetratricopeptide (TPR) repeat protein
MFKKIVPVCLLLTAIPSLLIAQVNFPDPSPAQTIRQDFAMSYIELKYGRPGAKGRKMIGHVEPYDSVWRAGANWPTKIIFRDAVEIGGTKVDTGTYVLYLIPTKNNWTFILNRGLENWGSDGYKANQDVLRFSVKPETTKDFRETLSYEFNAITGQSCELAISWENWKLRVPIVALIKDKLRGQIEASLQSNAPAYWFAAQFYYEYDKDNNKALEMISKAIDANEKRGTKPYWQYHYKAKILKDLGRKQEATEMASLSAKYAKEHGNRNNYIKLNEELIKSMK